MNKNLGTQKEEFLSNLNDLICDYSLSNWKVCEFYMTDANDFAGSLLDRKPNAPFYNLKVSNHLHNPGLKANGHAGNSYFHFSTHELHVNYSIKGKEYISVFIVYSLGPETGKRMNGLCGNHKSGNARGIYFEYFTGPFGELKIKSGNEVTTFSSFPSKANPITVNRINLLSVHFHTLNKNNAEVYCNGQQLD